MKKPHFIAQYIPVVDLTSDSDEEPSKHSATPTDSSSAHSPPLHPAVSDDFTPPPSPAHQSVEYTPSSPTHSATPPVRSPQPARQRPYWKGPFLVTARKTVRPPKNKNLAPRDPPEPQPSTFEIGESSQPAPTRDEACINDMVWTRTAIQAEQERTYQLAMVMEQHGESHRVLAERVQGLTHTTQQGRVRVTDGLREVQLLATLAVGVALFALTASLLMYFRV